MSKKQSKTLNKNKKKSKQPNVSTRTGIERMFKILGFLQNGYVNEAPINCKTLGAVLEVDRATVMRDIAFLRDRLGVEFEWDAEENKYRLYGDTKHLPSMELDEIDKLVLVFMEQAIGSLGGGELGLAMRKSFERLVSIFTGKYPKNGWGVPVSFPQKAGASELRVYHLMSRAIRSGKMIHVLWKNGISGVPSSMELHPLGMAFHDGHWVLEAVSPNTRESFYLNFSEVVQIEITKESVDSIGTIWSDPPKPTTAGAFDIPNHGDDRVLDAPLRAA